MTEGVILGAIRCDGLRSNRFDRIQRILIAHLHQGRRVALDLCQQLLLAGLGCSLRRCFRCTACAAASTHAVAAAHASASASHVNPPLAVNFSVKSNMKSGGKTL